MGDAHVYANHVEPLKEQLQNSLKPFPVGTLVIQAMDTLNQSVESIHGC